MQEFLGIFKAVFICFFPNVKNLEIKGKDIISVLVSVESNADKVMRWGSVGGSCIGRVLRVGCVGLWGVAFLKIILLSLKHY